MFYLSKYYLGLTALTSQLNSGRDRQENGLVTGLTQRS